MNVRLTILMVSGALLAGCASKAATTAGPVPEPAAEAAPVDSALHVGATVRVRGRGLGNGWRVGTVVESTGPHPCLAVKLAALHTGAPFYVPLYRLARLQADSRTNTGAFAAGLPPAQESDWAAVDLVRAQSARCRRGR